MTARALAARLGLNEVALHYVLRGRVGITVSTAVRLAAMFGVPAELWLKLQNQFDLEMAQGALADELARIKPYPGSPLDLDRLF